VSDETVSARFGTTVQSALASAGFDVTEITVPPGEGSKSWERAGEVLGRLALAGLDREDVVVALGGGVVGDLAGFCAAMYMRGIEYVQVPTTLLAQVDSSIGGKTGVDLAAGKNLAGAFRQPALVVTDTDTLASLGSDDWRSGLAEVAKTAILAGEDELSWLEGNADALLRRDRDAVAYAVCMCVAFKAGVVASDEREAGGRECLNLGHTLGHAIEKVAGYGTVPHGVAVAEGLRFAAGLAEDDGAPRAWTRRVGRLLDSLSLPPVELRSDAAALREAMGADKKTRAGRVRFVLASAPGEWECRVVEDDRLRERLARWAGADRQGSRG
jgi:3-dehydroquinate synthase